MLDNSTELSQEEREDLIEEYRIKLLDEIYLNYGIDPSQIINLVNETTDTETPAGGSGSTVEDFFS